MKYIISTFLLLLGFFSCKTNTLEKKDTPNVILIYADDLGRGLLGYEGQQIIKTPNFVSR